MHYPGRWSSLQAALDAAQRVAALSAEQRPARVVLRLRGEITLSEALVLRAEPKCELLVEGPATLCGLGEVTTRCADLPTLLRNRPSMRRDSEMPL